MNIRSLDFVLGDAGFGDNHCTLVVYNKVSTRARTVTSCIFTEIGILEVCLGYVLVTI